MLNVPIDRIVPLTDARDNFSRLVTDIEKQSDGMYVLTKGGKPSIALINIEFLTKLMNGGDSLPAKPKPEEKLVLKTGPAASSPAPAGLEPKREPDKINPSWTGSANPWPLADKADRPDVAPISQPAQPPAKPPAPAMPPAPPKPATPPPSAPPPPPPPKPPVPPPPQPVSAQGQPVPISKPASPAPPPAVLPNQPPKPNLPPPPPNDTKIPFSEAPKTVLEPGETPVGASAASTKPPAPATAPAAAAPTPAPATGSPAGGVADKPVQDLEI